MVYLVLANGFETIEALTAADILRRAEVPLRLVSLDGKAAVSSHGVEVKADLPLSEVKADTADMLILPGGGEGVKALENSLAVLQLVREVYERESYVAAICAAPAILADMGLLKGRNAVCYPASPFRERLSEGGALYQEDAGVVRDGHIITAKAAGMSLDFALTLAELLKGEDTAERVKQEVFYHG